MAQRRSKALIPRATDDAGFFRAALHEMRQPLQIIQGTAELMEASDPVDDLPGQVEAIRREAARLTTIFDDLRYRRDLEDNRLRLHITPVNAPPVVDELAAALERYYPAQLVTQYPKHLPLVLADPIHLRMILWTLLYNAARTGEAGQRRRDVIELAIRRRGRNLEFALMDSGARLPAKYHAQIFEPRASLPRGPRFGLGQGLYVARAVARAMQGELHHQVPTPTERSAVTRKGNTFILTLPLAGDDR